MTQIAISGPSKIKEGRLVKLAESMELEPSLSLGMNLATGAQPGIPEIIAKNFIANGGTVIGYSPFANIEEHTTFFKFNPSYSEMHFREGKTEGIIKDILKRNVNLIIDSFVGIYFLTTDDNEKYSIGVANELTCALNGGLPAIIVSEDPIKLEKALSKLSYRTKPFDIHLTDNPQSVKEIIGKYVCFSEL